MVSLKVAIIKHSQHNLNITKYFNIHITNIVICHLCGRASLNPAIRKRDYSLISLTFTSRNASLVFPAWSMLRSSMFITYIIYVIYKLNLAFLIETVSWTKDLYSNKISQISIFLRNEVTVQSHPKNIKKEVSAVDYRLLK